jgi:hypothetical protein
MMGEVYFSWIQSTLPKQEPDSIIVMDSTSYHSVNLEQVPTVSWEKDHIVTWLENHSMECSADVIKLELSERIKSVRGQYGKYVVDDTAEKAGRSPCFPSAPLSLQPKLD